MTRWCVKIERGGWGTALGVFGGVVRVPWENEGCKKTRKRGEESGTKPAGEGGEKNHNNKYITTPQWFKVQHRAVECLVSLDANTWEGVHWVGVWGGGAWGRSVVDVVGWKWGYRWGKKRHAKKSRSSGRIWCIPILFWLPDQSIICKQLGLIRHCVPEYQFEV